MRLMSFAITLALVFVLLPPAAAHSPGVMLTLTEPELGEWLFIWGGNVPVTVASGEQLDFSWTGEFEVPDGASIVGYRYGWDLLDFQYDPNDPGWAIPELQDVHNAPTRSFSAGEHNFVVYVVDDIGRSTTAVVFITVDDSVPADGTTVSRLKAAWGD